MNWQQATLQQLQHIIRYEEMIYKCFAESELERRLKEKGFNYPV